jgi:hypothetical protein
MKHILNRLFFVLCGFTITIFAFSQSLDQAKTMYNNGDYASAKPVFERLVKQSPNNSSYNQWYGVCCYETGDYENAEKYLLVANKRKVMESYRYLAKLYTNTYKFDKAVEMWDGYIELQKKKKDDTAESEELLLQVRNLRRMQENTGDIQVIDSIVVDKRDFLNAYNLSEDCGMVLDYNIFFKSDRKYESTAFLNQKEDKIYYGRPSDNGIYSIYSQTKLLDAWGDEKKLLPDSGSDSNYPFVLTDGFTMYFSSKGYGSIGGYDLFITRYNLNTNTYLTPEQMGMPFNSPANDYMMIIDETKGLGWFVSDRNQPEDKVCVYLFIPEASRRPVSNIEDPDIIRARASLTSIRDTWRNSSDYPNLITLAHKENTKKENASSRDFVFIVNDKTVYYSLNEIKSQETKDLYNQYLKIEIQVATLESKLKDIRQSYTKGNKAIREQLKPAILKAEYELRNLQEEAHLQEKKARNAENRRLGIKY